jgi:hypothetical protein
LILFFVPKVPVEPYWWALCATDFVVFPGFCSSGRVAAQQFFKPRFSADLAAFEHGCQPVECPQNL